MSENHSHQHSHHRHHHMDSASKFKRDSLKAIEQRKIMAKWGKIILLAIAIFLAILLALSYSIKY